MDDGVGPVSQDVLIVGMRERVVGDCMIADCSSYVKIENLNVLLFFFCINISCSYRHPTDRSIGCPSGLWQMLWKINFHIKNEEATNHIIKYIICKLAVTEGIFLCVPSYSRQTAETSWTSSLVQHLTSFFFFLKIQKVSIQKYIKKKNNAYRCWPKKSQWNMTSLAAGPAALQVPLFTIFNHCSLFCSGFSFLIKLAIKC